MKRNHKLLISFILCLLLMLTVTGSILAQDLRDCTAGDTRCDDSSSSSDSPDDLVTPPTCSELEPEGNGKGATITTGDSGSDGTVFETPEDDDCVGEPDDLTTGG